MALIFGWCVLAVSAVQAQLSFGPPKAAGPGGFKYPVKVTAGFYPSVAYPGGEVTVQVKADIEPGYYIYAMRQDGVGPVPSQPKINPNTLLEPIEGQDWREPQPKRKFDEGFEIEVNTFNGTVTFERTFRVAESATEGELRTSGTIMLQVCDATSCLPPRRIPFEASVLIRERTGEEAAAAPAPAGTEPPAAASQSPPAPDPTAAPAIEAAKPAAMTASTETESERESATLPFFLLAAMLAGFGALLMPCSYPMIPITIGFFSKKTGDDGGRRVGLVALYAGTMLAGFAAIGVFLTIARFALGWGAEQGGIANQFAANPWVNLALAGLFLAFALSFFGAFEISLPASWANKLQGGGAKSQRGLALSAMAMATAFVIISFTCTAPFMGLLIPQLLTGDVLRPLLGFLFFGLGFSLPFFLLGLAPGMISSLPRAGGWMNTLKVTVGLIELALAALYLSRADLVWGWGVLTREVLLALWVMVAVAVAMYLLGQIRLSHDAPVEGLSAGRLLGGLSFGALALYLAFGLFGGRLNGQIEAFMPPDKAMTGSRTLASQGAAGLARATEDAGHPPFILNDLEGAMAQARNENKPLFIDFTGWTCTNCRLMEKDMFPRPAVSERLDQFVRVSLYTDDKDVGDKYQSYQIEHFGTLALPFYAILSPDGETVISTFEGLTRDEEAFVGFLERGLSSDTAQPAATKESRTLAQIR
ncbi:MAG: protein-disulfide reductase DsbD family protein [Sumerlaeia bacterium]